MIAGTRLRRHSKCERSGCSPQAPTLQIPVCSRAGLPGARGSPEVPRAEVPVRGTALNHCFGPPRASSSVAPGGTPGATFSGVTGCTCGAVGRRGGGYGPPGPPGRPCPTHPPSVELLAASAGNQGRLRRPREAHSLPHATRESGGPARGRKSPGRGSPRRATSDVSESPRRFWRASRGGRARHP